MSNPLTAWAKELRREVFEFWQTNYSHWKPGFQVWYGPVEQTKTTLILGVQPGGDEGSFVNKRNQFEAGIFSLPTEHDYLTSNYDLARDTRKAVPKKVIERSVKTNLNFFRAPREIDWENGLDEASRKEIEEFCFIRIDELVQQLEPDLIITEGTASVYDKLKSEWGFSTNLEQKHTVGENREERLICVSHTDDFTVVGLKHPSSGRGLGGEEYIHLDPIRSPLTSVWMAIKPIWGRTSLRRSR